VTFSGHGVFWFDPSKQEYVMHWWDSMGGTGGEYRGQFSGDAWQWSTMAYYLGQQPDLYDRVMRYAWLDRAPLPWRLKAIWAHHRYVVGIKS